MGNEFHKNLTLDDIHTLPARIYADETARDADTDFNGDSSNLYKSVYITGISELQLLTSNTPTWVTIMSGEFTIPGIDDVLAVNQVIETVDRTITIEQDKRLFIDVYDTTSANFTNNTLFEFRDNGFDVFARVGTGFGGVSSENSLRLTSNVYDIELQNASDYQIGCFDNDQSSFNTRSQHFQDDDTVMLGVFTGNGAGATVDAKEIKITLNDIEIEDSISSKGMIYAGDYSGNFTDRSLVDKGYVDSRGIDDVLAVDQILTANRSIIGETNFEIQLESVDKTLADFDTFGNIEVRSDSVIISAGTGTGAGAFDKGRAIDFGPTSFAVFDSLGEKGLEYVADYSANFTNRSLVDKAYVDGLITTPGIDDVLAVNQIIGTSNRNIVLENDFDLLTDAFKETSLNFTTKAFNYIESDGIQFGAATGDGAGNIVDRSDILISQTDMEVRDDINEVGLKYLSDYSANFTDRSLIDKAYVDPALNFSNLNTVSGLINGGSISVASATTIDIAAGNGNIARYTDTANPDPMPVSWNAFNGVTITNVGLTDTTMIAIDENGAVVQFLIGALTDTARRQYIVLGAVGHAGGAIIDFDNAPKNTSFQQTPSFADFMYNVIGPANVSGNIFSANGSNLSIDKSLGKAFIPGCNFHVNSEVPDIETIGALTLASFQRVYRSSGGDSVIIEPGGPYTVIEPGEWDDGSGTLQTVGENYTIQRLYTFNSSIGAAVFVAYGQGEYSGKEDAIAAIGTENFEEQNPLPRTLLRGYLVVKKDASDLTDLDDAEFFEASSFRINGVGGSSATAGVFTPGGVNTSVQFNDNGSFGGDSNLTWDGSILTVDGEAQIGDGITGMISSQNLAYFSTVAPTSGTVLRGAVYGSGAGANLGTTTDVALFGALTGQNIIDAAGTAAFGSGALQNLDVGTKNTAMGDDALGNLGSGANNNNTAVGGSAAGNLNSGSGGLYLGEDVADTLTSGSDNIILNGDVPAASTSNFLNIGGALFGDLSTGKYQIGGALAVPTGDETLTVSGDLAVTGEINGFDLYGVANSLYLNTTAGLTAGFNTVIGTEAGSELTTGNGNFFGGYRSGEDATTATNNVGVGRDSMMNSIGASQCVAAGTFALQNVQSNNNIGIGYAAASSLTNGGGNIVIATNGTIPTPTTSNFLNIGETLFGNLSSNFIRIGGSGVVNGPEIFNVQGNAVIDSIQIGKTEDGQSSTYFYNSTLVPDTAQFSAFFGSMSGDSISSGGNNSGFGRESLRDLSIGIKNSAHGTRTLTEITQADGCSAFGAFALDQLGSGGGNDNNTAAGFEAATNLTAGDTGLYLGSQCAPTLTDGNGNIIVGHGVDVPAASTSDFLNIGDILSGDTSNGSVRIGAGAASAGLTSSVFTSLHLASTTQVFVTNNLTDAYIDANIGSFPTPSIFYNSDDDRWEGKKPGGQRIRFDTTNV